MKTVNASELLHNQFQHGHPKYIELALRDIELHNKKNHDYAQGGDPLGNFQRVSEILSLYPNREKQWRDREYLSLWWRDRLIAMSVCMRRYILQLSG